MTLKDVKALARKYNMPLDLHPHSPSEGWTIDKLPDEKMVGKNAWGKIFNETILGMKGWKDRFFFIDRRAILDAMAWRHHDSDINDVLPNNDFSILDVRALADRVLIFVLCIPVFSLPLVLPLLRIFLGFFLFSKTPKGMVRSGCSPKPSSQTAHNLSSSGRWVIPDKTDHQLEVKVEDPKVIAARKRKKAQAAKAMAKKKESSTSVYSSYLRFLNLPKVLHTLLHCLC
uniref:Uncharacterized protein n=1 Tax=Tanacetum cinerariifolium TaxID=118510 RepID=A0A6L2MPX8_TANCI|nr:hypothetical protein [Tanacetum cinerariifolium]